MEVDTEYPGTAVERLRNIQERVRSLNSDDLSKEWEEVRRKILWAGGLKAEDPLGSVLVKMFMRK